MTDKSDDKVGHLNSILAQGGGNLNDPIFKSSNARGLPGGGMLKFRVDRRITLIKSIRPTLSLARATNRQFYCTGVIIYDKTRQLLFLCFC